MYSNLKNKYQDANTMDSFEFKSKYNEDSTNYEGKSITNAGVIHSGAIAQYLGVLDPGLSVTTTNSAPMQNLLLVWLVEMQIIYIITTVEVIP